MRENPRSNQEIINAIDAYLAVKPDTTRFAQANNSMNDGNGNQDQVSESPTMEDEMIALSASVLPAYLKAKEPVDVGETILASENIGNDKKLRFRIKKIFKKNQRHTLKHEMLTLELIPLGANGQPSEEYIGTFGISLFDNIDASDENSPKEGLHEQEYLNGNKKVFKIRHREIDPRYRRQNLGTKLLHATETFVQEYADKSQEDKHIIATTAQLDVMKFFLKHGYEVMDKDRERLEEIVNFLECDATGKEHPKFRRSVSNYILPRDITDERFVKDQGRPYGAGVDVDLTRDSQGKEGSAITFIKKIPHRAMEKPLEPEVSSSIASTRTKLGLSSQSAMTHRVDDVPEGEAGIEWLLQHRADIYPWTEREIQFDNGGAPSASAFYYEAVRQYDERAKSTGYGRMRENHEEMDRARAGVSRLLSCSSDEIAFIQNTAAGVNIVAQGIDWQPGDEIIVTRADKEYPTNYAPWKAIAERFEKQRAAVKSQFGIDIPGIKIIEVGDEYGVVRPEDIEKALSSRTRLVTVSSVGWKNGYRTDLKGIGEAIQHRNAGDGAQRRTLFHVDGIQSIGAHDVNVKDCRIDFLSAGGSKWILADEGNGIFYCNKDALKELPNAPIGADSLKNWKDANSGLQEGTARIFEGGKSNTQGIIGLGAATALINRIGIENIERRIRMLAMYLEKKLEEKGYVIISPRGDTKEKTGMILFGTPKLEEEKDAQQRDKKCQEEMGQIMRWNALMDPNVKAANIQEKGIAVSVRDGRLRASIHYYNTQEEIDELIRRLPNIGER